LTEIDPFLARDSMHSALYAIARPSVCLSVTQVYHRKTVEVRIINFHRSVAQSL